MERCKELESVQDSSQKRVVRSKADLYVREQRAEDGEDVELQPLAMEAQRTVIHVGRSASRSIVPDHHLKPATVCSTVQSPAASIIGR